MFSIGMGVVSLTVIIGWVFTGIILREKLERLRASLPQTNGVAE